MKRNFITLVAMTVAAFFVGTEIAHAADFSIGGHMRTRYEAQDKENMNVNQEKDDAIATRVRIDAKTNINSDTSAHLQFQHIKTWGTNNASYTGSDADAGVGLHQAYFTLKNFAGTGLNAKVGRQQVVLDGHRLFGHTGWTSGAQTHDGLRLSHSHTNMTSSYGYIAASETGASDAIGGQVENDEATHFLHNNFQGVLGGSLSTIAVLQVDDCGRIAGGCGNPNNWWTVGARQAGKIFGLDYRGEAYWQVGEAGIGNRLQEMTIDNHNSIAPAVAGYSGGANRNAYMFGVRVGKSFNNVPWKPKVTLWYDYLSGNDDESVEEGDWSAFDTLYDTGHKFYGFMDMFTNGQGRDTNYLGLQDIAVKIVLKPADKWTLKADLHNFHLANSIGANPDMATLTGVCTANILQNPRQTNPDAGSACRSGGTNLGHELDLTLVHKYNPNVTLSAGYSQFMSEALWHNMYGSENESGDANAKNVRGQANTAEWIYVQAMVKF